MPEVTSAWCQGEKSAQRTSRRLMDAVCPRPSSMLNQRACVSVLVAMRSWRRGGREGEQNSSSTAAQWPLRRGTHVRVGQPQQRHFPGAVGLRRRLHAGEQPRLAISQIPDLEERGVGGVRWFNRALRRQRYTKQKGARRTVRSPVPDTTSRRPLGEIASAQARASRSGCLKIS